MRQHFVSIYLLFAAVVNCSAQGISITYNHDESFMQQFLFTEIGTGSLTPEPYYLLFHNSYRNTHMGQSKLVLRAAMSGIVYQEIDHAKDIESALKERAKVEALNMADRQPYLDLSWATEGPRIEKKMNLLYNSIQKISANGGKKETSEIFELKYNMLTQAIESIKESYMPASERKEQYGAIYDDIIKAIDQCESAVLYLKCCRLCDDLKQVQKVRRANLANIALQAHGRWKTTLSQVSGGNRGSGGSGNGISAD